MAIKFHGIIVYEIIENGNVLNAIYANTEGKSKKHYDIDNEIARKEQSDNKGIGGRYKCRYIGTAPDRFVVTNCLLTITKQGEIYEFVWSDDEASENKNAFFTGIGLMVGNNHISVSYINA